ncbi:MAG: cell division protein FtsQ/DivIB [Pseudomonadota bacterium]
MRALRLYRASIDPAPRRPDPAPSRWAYRMERLWLRPRVRLFCRRGLPLLAVTGLVALWASDPQNVRAVTDTAAEIRRSIEMRPEFQVDVIGIDGASPELADEIRIVMGVRLPVSSFDLDLDALRARLERLPGVASAELRLRGGGYLSVEITERAPALIWQTRAGPVLIDETGAFVAALRHRPGIPALPQIAGEGADLATDEALALFEAAAPLGDRVRGLVRMGERRWDLVLTDDRRIQLPAHGAEAALDRVIALEMSDDILSADILRIDLRNPDRMTVQLTPYAQALLRAARSPAPGPLAEED